MRRQCRSEDAPPASVPAARHRDGALVIHITGAADSKTIQPMNVNFGIFPSLFGAARGGRKGRKERSKKAHGPGKGGFRGLGGSGGVWA